MATPASGHVLRSVALVGGVALTLAAGACASGGAEPPAPGYLRGASVQLAGTRVMILPVQMGGTGDLDREIGYALSGRGPDVDWVTSGELRTAAARNPGMEAEGLAVQPFLSGDLVRIGDPLFGQLYRLGGLVDASYAVVPVQALAATDGAVGVTMELSVALVDVRNGLVPWFAVVAGRPGAAGDMYTVATVAEALADRLLP